MYKKILVVISLLVGVFCLSSCSKKDVENIREVIEIVDEALQTPTSTPTNIPSNTPNHTTTRTPTAIPTASETPTNVPPTNTPVADPTFSPTQSQPTIPLPVDTPSVPIGLEGVVWLHGPRSAQHNVGVWNVTSTLHVSINPREIVLAYDKANIWPIKVNSRNVKLVANVWVLAKKGNTWYAATWEWMRPGQTSKPTDDHGHKIRGDHVKRTPLDGNWRPKPGEEIGIFVSCIARDMSLNNCRERTNLYWLTW